MFIVCFSDDQDPSVERAKNIYYWIV